MSAQQIGTLFTALGISLAADANGLVVTAPADGATMASLAMDTPKTLAQKIDMARAAQTVWQRYPRYQRQQLVERFSAALKERRELLAQLIHLEAGKTPKEALAEVDSTADILLKTIHDATLPELGGMLRCKERPPVGVVGLITSFNFPLVVAGWSLAPALLAANAVVWKPSEKTPLVALAAKIVFDAIAGDRRELLQVVIGGRQIGEALVAHQHIDMVSATGSVAMGQGIKKTLSRKKEYGAPILELGGNNGIIISEKSSSAHMEFAVESLMNSFLGTTGQRCTNTRRVIAQRAIFGPVADAFKRHIAAFLAGHVRKDHIDAENPYGYGPLIDADAFARFEQAKKRVAAEGGEVLFGARLFAGLRPQAYYVEPALAIMSGETAIMHQETFAPILFLAPYDTFDEAIAMLNAPDNAGLVSGIYTQNQAEADRFAAASAAGHALINSPKGTGTPAFGMGFGGNKESGEGEILNAADPLSAFTRRDAFTRIAQNKAVLMDR